MDILAIEKMVETVKVLFGIVGRIEAKVDALVKHSELKSEDLSALQAKLAKSEGTLTQATKQVAP